MAADAVELATAYVSLVPSMQGAQGQITKELVPGAESAGDAAGKKSAGRFSASFGKAAAVGGAVMVGGLVAGFKGLYEVGSTFDDVADTIRVGTGASGDALDGLVDVAKSVGKTVPASFESAGQTVADVNTRMGLTGGTLEKVASQYLEAGRILGEEVDIGKTSAAFSAFKITGDDVAGGMDTLFQISQATGLGMNELATAVSSSAPAMQNLGFSFEETAALAGSLDKAGLNSAQTLAAMSKGMVTLAKDGEKPQDAFKRVTSEIGSFVKKGDTAAALDLAGKVFGTRGAAQFVGAVQGGTLALDDLVGATHKTNDTILGVGGETQDFAEKWKIVQNNAAAALEPLGSAVFAGLGDALMALTPQLEGFGAWLGDNTWVLGAFAAVVGGALVVAFAAWAVSIWATTAALLANPVTWIIVGIVALIAGLVLLIANWDAVASFLTGVWNNVVNWAVGVWRGLGDFFSGWISNVVKWFNSGISGLQKWLAGTWSNISSFAQGVWSGFLGFIGGIVGSISSRITGGINGVRSWLAGAWRGISSFAMSVWNGLVGWVAGIPGRILGGLRAIGNLAGTVGSWINGMRNAAMGQFNGLVGWVGGIPGRILGALGSLGGLLVGAGNSIIQGFLSGLQSAFRSVQDFVGGIGKWIADHKGPKAYDLALLVPAGGWIMQGLGRGIADGIPGLERQLGDVSETVRGTLMSGRVDVSARSVGLAGYDVSAAADGSGRAIYVQNPWTGEYMLARVDDRVRSGISGANDDMGRRRPGVRG